MLHQTPSSPSANQFLSFLSKQRGTSLVLPSFPRSNNAQQTALVDLRFGNINRIGAEQPINRHWIDLTDAKDAVDGLRIVSRRLLVLYML